MKDCEMVQKNLCLGCTGLVEDDWIGKEHCQYYKQLSRITGFDIYKQKIEQMKMEGLDDISVRNK